MKTQTKLQPILDGSPTEPEMTGHGGTPVIIQYKASMMLVYNKLVKTQETKMTCHEEMPI